MLRISDLRREAAAARLREVEIQKQQCHWSSSAFKTYHQTVREAQKILI